jgi:hypothetical protein
VFDECAQRPIMLFEVCTREERDYAYGGLVFKEHVGPVVGMRVAIGADGLDVALQTRVYEFAFLGRRRFTHVHILDRRRGELRLSHDSSVWERSKLRYRMKTGVVNERGHMAPSHTIRSNP